MNGYKLMRSDRNFKKMNVKKKEEVVCAFIRDNFKIKHIVKSNG